MTEANPNLRKAICLMVIGEKYEKLYNENKNVFEEYSQKCGAELILIKILWIMVLKDHYYHRNF